MFLIIENFNMIDPLGSKFDFENDVILNVDKYLSKLPTVVECRANEQLKWFPTDREDSFNIHYNLYPEMLNFYKDNPIVYNINNYFCRSNFDFKRNKDLKVDIFLGCSHTFGIGLHEKDLWWNKISEYTDNVPINLGLGGSSVEEHFIRLAKVIDLFDVQNVVWYAPHFYRYTFPDKNKFQTFNFTHKGEDEHFNFPYKEAFVRDYLIQDDYTAYYSWKHITAASGLCLSRGIPLFVCHRVEFKPEDVLIREFNSNGIVTKVVRFDMDNNIPARDMLHMTVKQQSRVGNHILELVKNNKEGYNPYNRK